jgi:hypothetical protein
VSKQHDKRARDRKRAKETDTATKDDRPRSWYRWAWRWANANALIVAVVSAGLAGLLTWVLSPHNQDAVNSSQIGANAAQVALDRLQAQEAQSKVNYGFVGHPLPGRKYDEQLLIYNLTSGFIKDVYLLLPVPEEQFKDGDIGTKPFPLVLGPAISEFIFMTAHGAFFQMRLGDIPSCEINVVDVTKDLPSVTLAEEDQSTLFYLGPDGVSRQLEGASDQLSRLKTPLKPEFGWSPQPDLIRAYGCSN